MTTIKPKGVFSSGEQTFRDIENFSRKISPLEHNSVETNYALQARLGNYWKNNPAQVLEFSKRFSGESTINNNPAPLGGAINYSKSNAVNRQDSGFFSDEFNFWDLDSNLKKVVVDKRMIQDGNVPAMNEDQKTPTNQPFNKLPNLKDMHKIEKFANTASSAEENTLYISCGCIFIFIIIAIIIYMLLSQPPDSKLFGA